MTPQRHTLYYGDSTSPTKPYYCREKEEMMAKIERPASTREYEQEQPNSPGRWWFVGSVVFKGEYRSMDSVNEIDEPRAYDIVDQAGRLTITEDGSAYHSGVEWIGWWVKQTQ